MSLVQLKCFFQSTFAGVIPQQTAPYHSPFIKPLMESPVFKKLELKAHESVVRNHSSPSANLSYLLTVPSTNQSFSLSLSVMLLNMLFSEIWFVKCPSTLLISLLN